MQTSDKKREVAEATQPAGWKSSNLLKLYGACMENAQELVDEAELLYDNGHFARAFMLAFTAWEEIGKAQLVADYYTDCVSEKEFKAAFSQHGMKAAYVNRFIELSGDGKTGLDATIQYDTKEARELVAARMNSLYVRHEEDYEPVKPSSLDKESARLSIVAVRKQIHEIEFAEWLNQRIGTKGLFK